MLDNQFSKILANFSNTEDPFIRKSIQKTIEDRRRLEKAILQFSYNDKRAFEKNRYFDLLYNELYKTTSLDGRKFINFGPGSFKHKYWQTADKKYDGALWSETREKSFIEKIDHSWDMYEREFVNIENDSIEAAYASHIIEHGYDEDVIFFFEDVYRILKKGGVFRITAPDIDLAIRAVTNRDYSYFAYGQYLKGGEKLNQVLGPIELRRPIEYWVLEHCSLITNKSNSFFVPPHDCPEFFWRRGPEISEVYNTLSEASFLSDRELNKKIGSHVNWFNFAKSRSLLIEAGFTDVRISGYGQSVCPVLRDVRYFDNTNPSVSFYLDAIK